MEEFKPKSSLDNKRPAESEKRYEAVNTETVETKPRSLFARAVDEIFHFNGKNFIEWAVMDNIVPSCRDFLANFMKSGIDSVFYGGPTSQNRSSGYSTVSYQKYWNGGSSVPQSSYHQSQVYSVKPDYRSLVFEDYGKAQWALNQLKDAIVRYQYARVGDYIDMANNVYKDERTGRLVPIVPESVDYDHGWADLSNARVVPAGGGKYRVDLPTPAPLD